MAVARFWRIRHRYLLRLNEKGIWEHEDLSVQQTNAHEIFWQRRMDAASEFDRNHSNGMEHILDYRFWDLAVLELGAPRAEMCFGRGRGKGQGKGRLMRIRESYLARLAEEGIEEHEGLTLQQTIAHEIFWQRRGVAAIEFDRDHSNGIQGIQDYRLFELTVLSLGRSRAEMCFGSKGRRMRILLNGAATPEILAATLAYGRAGTREERVKMMTDMNLLLAAALGKGSDAAAMALARARARAMTMAEA